jgi:myo-inositol-1(or 4)-monophosphatase
MNTLITMTMIAREAGQYMLGSTETESTDKSNSRDFVTVADIKSQEILRNRLLEIEPSAVVLSEEDPEDVRAPMYDSDFTGYILDPIDGTYNFKRGMQESAISIGYIENGVAIRGVIYDPFKDEMYTAEVGAGAFQNGKAIQVSQQSEIAGASIATSNGYDAAALSANLNRHLQIYTETGVLPWTSCPGSAVLAMAWIACGRIDALHHNGMKPWDNAAAFLLVTEAGGTVCRLDGQPSKFTDNTVIIGNKPMVAFLKDLFASGDPTLLT